MLATDATLATITILHFLNLYKQPDASWTLAMTRELAFLVMSLLASLYCLICNLDLAQGSFTSLWQRMCKCMRHNQVRMAAHSTSLLHLLACNLQLSLTCLSVCTCLDHSRDGILIGVLNRRPCHSGGVLQQLGCLFSYASPESSMQRRHLACQQATVASASAADCSRQQAMLFAVTVLHVRPYHMTPPLQN